MRFSILTLAVAALSLVGCAQAEDAEPTPTGFGIIRLREFYGWMTVNGCFRDGPATPTTACRTSTIGACAVTECSFPQPSSVQGPSNVSSASAGTISAVGTLADGGVGVASSAPSEAGSDADSRFWAAGTTVTVSGTGGRVPAFEHPVKLPKPITLTSPACGIFCDAFPSNEPLTLTWTGDAEATVVAHLNASHTQEGVAYVMSAECVLPRSPAILPAELLTRFEAGGGQHGYSIGIDTLNQERFVAGDFVVLLEAAGGGSGFYVRPPPK